MAADPSPPRDAVGSSPRRPGHGARLYALAGRPAGAVRRPAEPAGRIAPRPPFL